MKVIEIIGKNYFGNYRNVRVGCRAIIIKDDLILMSYMKKTNQYMIPGGGIEEGENEIEGVKREIQEETGFIIDADECVLEIDEYYEDIKYVNKYFFGKIIADGETKLTAEEKEVGLEPRWVKIQDAISLYSKHELYRDSDEMRRGMYLRDYTALMHLNL